jgi:hypothetical protein
VTELAEYVEVVVKVPKRLMQLLEDKDYFGWRKEDFFKMCVQAGTSSEISELDFSEVDRIGREYGKDITVAWYVRVDKIPDGLKKTLVF